MWNLIQNFKKKNNNINAESLTSRSDSKSFLDDCLASLAKICPPWCATNSSRSAPSTNISNNRFTPANDWMNNPFTIEELSLAVRSLKTKSAPGLDQIDNKISILPVEYLESLLDIFNGLIESGTFPEPWKHTLLIFIPKPGSKGVRPISLLSCFFKLLEKCIYFRLRWWTESQFIFPDSQFGFRNFKLGIDNLVILTNHIKAGFLSNKATAAVFLDIASAFDNVIPDILLKDLSDIGLPPRISNFIHKSL